MPPEVRAHIPPRLSSETVVTAAVSLDVSRGVDSGVSWKVQSPISPKIFAIISPEIPWEFVSRSSFRNYSRDPFRSSLRNLSYTFFVSFFERSFRIFFNIFLGIFHTWSFQQFLESSPKVSEMHFKMVSEILLGISFGECLKRLVEVFTKDLLVEFTKELKRISGIFQRIQKMSEVSPRRPKKNLQEPSQDVLFLLFRHVFLKSWIVGRTLSYFLARKNSFWKN